MVGEPAVKLTQLLLPKLTDMMNVRGRPCAKCGCLIGSQGACWL